MITAPFFGFALLHISLGSGIPDLSLSRLVIALLVALVAAQVATGRRIMARITRVDFLVTVSVIGIGVSIVGATSKAASLAWYFESFLMPVLTYFVARNLITDEHKMKGAQRALEPPEEDPHLRLLAFDVVEDGHHHARVPPHVRIPVQLRRPLAVHRALRVLPTAPALHADLVARSSGRASEQGLHEVELLQ